MDGRLSPQHSATPQKTKLTTDSGRPIAEKNESISRLCVIKGSGRPLISMFTTKSPCDSFGGSMRILNSSMANLTLSEVQL